MAKIGEGGDLLGLNVEEKKSSASVGDLPFAGKIGIFAVLAALNFAVFFRHYLGWDIFPWDFWKSYFAVVAFWTNLVRHGTVPQWVPFQYMGYPFFLNPQTGFFYPPLWFFVIFKVDYTLRMAVLVQALHVLFGSYGSYLLIRSMTRDWRPALFGGIVYLFFGGFYSNSEHIDIVRAYAWLPWLFWAGSASDRLRARNYLLPFIIYFAISGSYPGNIGSHVFLLGLYLLIEGYLRWKRGISFHVTLFLFVFAGLGITLSAPIILPQVLLRSYMHHSIVQLASGNWTFHDWLSFITPAIIGHAVVPGFTGDASMISAYIGVPALVLVFLTTRRSARQNVTWWFFLAVSLVLALGQASFFYQTLVRILPLLGLSRFPASDYRGAAAFSLDVLASISLDDLLHERRPRSFITRRLAWSLACPAALLAGVFEVQMPNSEMLLVCALWLVVLGAIYLYSRANNGMPTLLCLTLTIVTCLEARHVLNASAWMWTSYGANIEQLYVEKLGFTTYSPKAHQALVSNAQTRPQRINRARNDFSWEGYLDGSYQIGDYGNTNLQAQFVALNDPVLLTYMRMPLTPLLFLGQQSVTRPMIEAKLSANLPERILARRMVAPEHYKVNSVTYDVALPYPATMVVNEIWFPGWQGDITAAYKPRIQIGATKAAGVLRAWNLPKGNFKLVTRFTTPYLVTSLFISAATLIAYGVALYLALHVRRRQTRFTSAFDGIILSAPSKPE